MDPLETGLFVVVIPGAIALGIAFLGRGAKIAGSLAVAAGALAGAWALLGAPALWPLEATHRFGHVIVLALAASLIGTRLGPTSRLAVGVGAGLLIAFAIVGPLLEHRYSGVTGAAVIALGALLIGGTGLAFERVGAIGDRVGFLLAIVSMSVASVAAGLSGSVMLAQLGGAFTAALGGAWLLTLRQSRGWLAGGGTLVASALVSLVGLAVLYSSTGVCTTVPILVTPLAYVVFARWFPSKRAALALAATVIGISTLAIVPLIGGEDASSDDDYGYGYE